jgi:hypothetical protein
MILIITLNSIILLASIGFSIHFYKQYRKTKDQYWFDMAQVFSMISIIPLLFFTTLLIDGCWGYVN